MDANTTVIDLKEPGFFANTMAFFGMALLVTGIGTFAGFQLAMNMPAVFSNPLIFYGAIISELVLVFTAHSWSRNIPFGYGMFALYAFLSGFTLVPILAMAGAVGGATLVAKGLFSAVAVFLAAAIYGWTSHHDLAGMRGFLFMALVGIIMMGILGIIFPWNNTVEIVVSSGTVLLFAGFTMYDIQRLQRGAVLNPMMAAIALYLNFINLFVSILRIMIALGGRD